MLITNYLKRLNRLYIITINTENLIGSLITMALIILLMIKLFAMEYVTKFTQELFNSKTKKKANLIFTITLKRNLKIFSVNISE